MARQGEIREGEIPPFEDDAPRQDVPHIPEGSQQDRPAEGEGSHRCQEVASAHSQTTGIRTIRIQCEFPTNPHIVRTVENPGQAKQSSRIGVALWKMLKEASGDITEK